MKEVTVSKELFDRTFKEKCEWKDKYWKAYDELVEQDREIERLNKENTILRQNSQYLVKQKDELEEVINKAIEYIEDNTYKSNTTEYMDLTGISELLDILKGVNLVENDQIELDVLKALNEDLENDVPIG